MPTLSTCRRDKRVQLALTWAGQRAQSLHRDRQCGAEGEGEASLRTSRQGEPRLLAAPAASRGTSVF